MPVLGKSHAEVKRIITQPETVEKLRMGGVEELVTRREQHAHILKENLDKYAALIRSLKLAPAN